jgi:SAM-dependent methyltransferase
MTAWRRGYSGRPLPRALEFTTGGISGADTLLEVAAGTGLMTAVIAPRVRQVVATDYADNMLAIFRERMKTAGISNVETAHRGRPSGSLPEPGDPASRRRTFGRRDDDLRRARAKAQGCSRYGAKSCPTCWSSLPSTTSVSPSSGDFCE